MDIQKNNLQRRVNTIRFTIPFILFLIVTTYEVWEHWLLEGKIGYDLHLTSEVLFFGILGPAAVFIVLSYVTSLLKNQIDISSKLEELNRNQESIIAERTNALELRNVELAQANIELQELDQLKSDFVSLVSHELRGPLTTLNGGLEVALQYAEKLPQESRHILGGVQK